MSNPQDSAPFREPRLSPDDQRLLDALVDVGFDRNALSALSPADSRRRDAICDMLGLMLDYPAEDASETLIHATLARIDRYEDAHAAHMSFDNQQGRLDGARRGWRIRVPDFITVAAVLLIAVSIFWPVLSSYRQRNMDLSCANNLRQLGYGFSQYAADNNGAMPVALAGPSLSWDQVCNVLNLEPLVSGHYCEVGHLNCPGHDHHFTNAIGSSYSYRWFVPGARPTWGAGRVTVVLGDLNPMVDAARSGTFLPPLSVSLNHAGRGQNVLLSDGSTLWLEQPLVGRGDNIWLPNGAIQLRYGENPRDAMDVFLTH